MTRIIAEAGVNHNGDERLALQLIRVAAEAGADVVKFQTFKASSLASRSARQAQYQSENNGTDESQLAMLSRLELDFSVYERLVSYCKELDVEFLSTAFDSQSLAFLVDTLELKTLKLASGEITNAPFVLEHARTGCDLIVSTGMATLADIEAVLGVIAFGYTADHDQQPNADAFQAAYLSEVGQSALRGKVTLLHCTTEYPAPIQDINLKAMDTMRQAFCLDVGYSDHSTGITVPIAAVARGAVLIEKHFTLDKKMPGPDHKASLEPTELAEMVGAIRDVDSSLGDGIKGPRPSEIKNKAVARKSLVAASAILQGDVFSFENVAIKRPGDGLSPFRYWDLIGQVAKNSYSEGEMILE